MIGKIMERCSVSFFQNDDSENIEDENRDFIQICYNFQNTFFLHTKVSMSQINSTTSTQRQRIRKDNRGSKSWQSLDQDPRPDRNMKKILTKTISRLSGLLEFLDSPERPIFMISGFLHLIYQIFELGCISLQEALEILQFCKKTAAYFQNCFNPMDPKLKESHVLVLNHIMLLIQDELAAPSEDY